MAEDIGRQVKKSGYRKISHRKGRGCEKGTWRMETLDTGRPSNQGPIVAPASNYKVHIFDNPDLQKKRKKTKKKTYVLSGTLPETDSAQGSKWRRHRLSPPLRKSGKFGAVTRFPASSTDTA